MPVIDDVSNHRYDLPISNSLAAGMVNENDLIFFDNGQEITIVRYNSCDSNHFTGILLLPLRLCCVE